MQSFSRRQFSKIGSSLLLAGALPSATRDVSRVWECTQPIPTYSITPVVSDGYWIDKDPPTSKDRQGAYYHPRDFEVTIGISAEGTGNAVNFLASTATPMKFGEQAVVDHAIETVGCQARIRQVDHGASVFEMAAPILAAGQTVSALAKYRLRVSKSYAGFERDQFPAKQQAHKRLPKTYLRSSPGINAHASEVTSLLRSLVKTEDHPWDKARRFYDWVWNEIAGVPGEYTSVEQAIRKKSGDCEERATVFIALCRAARIPARLVWVPSHNWAEIGLLDSDKVPHWIPIHTAAYNWFGWTGTHEIVLQKGDRIRLPNRNSTVRLVDDWFRVKGKRPHVRYTATVTPSPGENGEPGPGARLKQSDGSWQLVRRHSADRFMRDR